MQAPEPELPVVLADAGDHVELVARTLKVVDYLAPLVDGEDPERAHRAGLDAPR